MMEMINIDTLLRELLDFVCAKFHEEPGVFKLLIVDSVMAAFTNQMTSDPGKTGCKPVLSSV